MRSVRLAGAVVGVLSAVATGCDGGGSGAARAPGEARSVVVSSGEFGAAWPFSVESGVLACRGKAITFRVDDAVYGLNVEAWDRSDPSPFPIWRWDDGPAVDKRMSLTPLVERGLELCE